MRFTYDPLADAINIIFIKGKVIETQEISKGVFLDLGVGGKPLYLEILDASRRFNKSKRAFGRISLEPFKYSKKDIRELVAIK